MSVRSRWQQALAASAVLALAGCGLGDDGGSAGSSGADVINARLITDPTGFDPASGKAADDYYVSRLLYDTLIRRGDNGSLVPGLATEWTARSAASYEITLRKDATCADGTAITPTVVAESLGRVADPSTGSTVSSLIFGDAGRPKITPDDAAGTLAIELAGDWADLPVGLSLPQAGVVCPAGLADVDGLAKGSVPGAFSGPYTLAKATSAVRYEFELRKDYDVWPKFEPALEGRPAGRIVLTPTTDQTTIANKLLAGEFDTANLIDANVDRLEGAEGFSTFRVASSTLYLVFNQRAGAAGGDAELRQAVAQAIDANAFNAAVTNKRGTRLLSIDSPTVPCVNTDEALVTAADASAAKQVLAGRTIRLVGTTSLDAANEYVAEILRKAGATVKLESLDGATWATRTAGGSSWDITLQGSVNLVGTLPSSLLRVLGPLTEDGGTNKGGADNQAGVAALTEAMSSTEESARCEALQTAQRTVLERNDIVPLSTLPATVVTRDGVSVRAFGEYLDPATLRLTD